MVVARRLGNGFCHLGRNVRVLLVASFGAGVQFVVLGDRDVVIFKVLEPPSRSEFSQLVRHARGVAKRTGMKQSDIAKAVAKVRRTK